MSKKLAEGIDALILDVKTGTGAFMRTLGRAWELARAMVETGRRMNKRVVALITDMNEPLGLKVGNALEVEESLDTLRGEGPADLTELCRELAAYMLWVGQAAPAVADGRRMYDEVIASGKALQKFQEIVEAQGGNPRIVENPGLLPQASGELKIVADRDGVVAGLDAARIGLSGVILGAGRQTVDSVIDPAVGIVMSRKTGDPVRCGDTVCTLLFNDDTRLQEAADLCRSAMIIAEKAESDRQLIKEIIQ
jgi:thymidine phosphorylase